MSDVEDDAEFGSHFLDSMLEVEMTEEDNELDVSKSYDPLETLPPTPTFDLQSETFSYQNVYRNAIPQPVLATLPLGTSTASNVPLVIKPNSMLIYSGEVPPLKPASVLPPAQKISPKSNAKTPAKSVNTNISAKNTSADEEIADEEFMKEVFRPEYVKNVFVKADQPWDVSLVSEEEMKYYKTCFKDVTKVQSCRLHCTICDKHLGCGVNAEKKINVHTILKVLTCKPCFEFYGDGNFPCDKGDNCEIYCRWCGQGGALVCCSFCPRVFCKRCVKRNFGSSFLKTIEKATDWACFCCAQKPLWPHRAVCRALLDFIAQRKTDSKAPQRDSSSCCKGAGLTRKKFRDVFDKSKTGISQPQLKVNPAAQSLDSKNKPFPPSKTGKEQLSLTPVVELKATDKVNSDRNSKSAGINIFSPRSIVAGNSIIRGITTTAPAKLYSSYPSPQLIQGPVIHGETLITPPSRLLMQTKDATEPPSGYNSSYVRVSFTHQSPNLDINKIPTVKIPHEVQGLVLRLIFPDNKMQYVRLASDGTGCKASKDFPLPSFKENGASFVEKNLAEAFKISKTMYEKLSRIREKVNSRTSFTEESVFNSSVKKLHLTYKKAVDLFQDLDKTLLESHEEWKNEGKTAVDIIDISDDETAAAKKGKPNKQSGIKEKSKKISDDSDIEILDDVIVNGKPPTSNNFKEKYRLRSSADQEKTHLNGVGAVRKRRRGRLRRTNKRLKTARIQNGQPEKDPLKTEMEEEATTAAAAAAEGEVEDEENDFDARSSNGKSRANEKIVMGGPESEAGSRGRDESSGEKEDSVGFGTYSWPETGTTEIKTETLEIPSEEMDIENPGLVENS